MFICIHVTQSVSWTFFFLNIEQLQQIWNTITKKQKVIHCNDKSNLCTKEMHVKTTTIAWDWWRTTNMKTSLSCTWQNKVGVSATQISTLYYNSASGNCCSLSPVPQACTHNNITKQNQLGTTPGSPSYPHNNKRQPTKQLWIIWRVCARARACGCACVRACMYAHACVINFLTKVKTHHTIKSPERSKSHRIAKRPKF